MLRRPVESALYATVEFGLDTQLFLKTPIGQYLLRKAAEERIDALADLVEVSPADTTRSAPCN